MKFATNPFPMAWRAAVIAAAVLLCPSMSLQAEEPAALEKLSASFADPPLRYHSWPLYWLNGTLDGATLRQQIEAMKEKCGFGGFAPLAMAPTRPDYLTDAYFSRYGEMLDEARKLGLTVVFYDDIDFPSGSAGGRLQKEYPQHTLKNLRKEEYDVAGGADFEKPVPHRALMAAVAMEAKSRKRVNLSEQVKDGSLRWAVPAGQWKIMFFYCVNEGRLVDYLDPEAVDCFLRLTYDAYAARFGEYFGTTIKMSFFDDVAMCYTSGNRTWTLAFNEKFKKKNGYDPALLYPALWYDIGPDTAAARDAMFGFRAELMAEGFVRKVHDWAKAHKIQCSGHPAGNYNPQPVDAGGDNIKFYKYCDVPLTDSIHFYGHGRNGFKLITSASSCYDRPLTAVEIYGNYPNASVDAAMFYRSAMELYVRGANLMLPHGMWYDPAKMTIPPEISDRNARFGAELPAYNRFIARCSMLLQGGRHVADIGMVYPIASLHAAAQFDVPGSPAPNWGYEAPSEIDYLAISDRLTGGVRQDFTVLHPEIIDERCSVEDAVLKLSNDVNHESYRVVILPGGKVISWSVLQKIQQFYNQRGRVIATTQLPFQSAEVGHDDDVRRAVKTMFGVEPVESTAAQEPCRVRIEVHGSTIKTFLRGELIDTTTDETFARGGVGFREADHELGVFSDVKVTAPDGKTLLKDDFRGDLAQWVNVDRAAARQRRLILEENQIFRSRAGGDWTDYCFEAVIDEAKPVAGLVFRAADDRNGYMWQFDLVARRLRPHKKVGGQWHVLKAVNYGENETKVTSYRAASNAQGGKAYFAPHPNAATLAAILDDALSVPDIRVEGDPQANKGGGMLSCLHKVKDGLNLYYFANSSDERVDASVCLRGRVVGQWFDPHTGQTRAAQCVHAAQSGEQTTRIRLVLEPVHSVFFVAPLSDGP